eukprot:m.486078 g.486078  ORF g.486078 m.486078 type:complete len:96 (+) comp76437_c0_seq1:1-288(+)
MWVTTATGEALFILSPFSSFLFSRKRCVCGDAELIRQGGHRTVIAPWVSHGRLGVSGFAVVRVGATSIQTPLARFSVPPSRTPFHGMPTRSLDAH